MGQSACLQHPAGDGCTALVPHGNFAESCWGLAVGEEEFFVLQNQDGRVRSSTLVLTKRALDQGGEVSKSGDHPLLTARRDSLGELGQTGFQEEYSITRTIAKGSYAEVFEVASTKQGPGGKPRSVAAKRFGKGPLGGDIEIGLQAGPEGSASRRARADLRRECLVFNSLEHPHLLKLFECFGEEEHHWALVELCPGGDLFSRILSSSQARRREGGAFDELVARCITRQMLSGLCYLHDRAVVHCDVKPENFLLLGAPGSRYDNVVKLCDFGSATWLSEVRPRAMAQTCTLSYTPPEVYARRGATLVGDAWSLGVVVYAILVGLNPFRSQEDTKEKILKRIMSAHINKARPAWKRLSRAPQDLILNFIVVDEVSRLSCQDAIRHPWMVEGDDVEPPDRMAERYLSPSAMTKASRSDLAVFVPALLSAMAHFAKLDLLQRCVLMLCAQLTPDLEVMDASLPVPWYCMFFALDENQDGRIDLPELLTSLSALLGPAAPEVAKLEALAAALDLDGSGAVEWVEWVALALSSAPEMFGVSEPIRTVFRLLDCSSGDELVSAEDLARFFAAGAVPPRDKLVELLRPWATGRVPLVNSGNGEQGSMGGFANVNSEAETRGPALTFADLQRLLEGAVRTLPAKEGGLEDEYVLDA
mmetsp:Transcript_10154/g.26096  ORF Transcript_10154/g.26096 Transcript_10154/m.26096 type:complete len:648 (+) Transcript_10154:21-1964(+)